MSLFHSAEDRRALSGTEAWGFFQDAHAFRISAYEVEQGRHATPVDDKAAFFEVLIDLCPAGDEPVGIAYWPAQA